MKPVSTPIIADGTKDRVVEPPRVVLPAPGLFADRAARFEARARNHPMGEFLRVMAQVAQAQHEALGSRTAEAPADATRAASRDYGMPPFSALSHARSPTWRADLAQIVELLRARGVAAATLATLDRLDDAAIEALADRILAGTTLDGDAALVPFVGAALQVYFTRNAAALDVADLQRMDVPTVCPVCATRPVASVVRIGGDRNNFRYLCCALCATEWYMVRVKCSSCESDSKIEYLALDDGSTASLDGTPAAQPVRAEACGECKTYLKILSQDKDPYVEPVADDLATLALDVLVDEQGYARSGPNLLFHPGGGEA